MAGLSPDRVRPMMQFTGRRLLGPKVPWPTARARMEAFGRFPGPPRGTDVRVAQIGGVPAEDIVPRSGADDRVLLYVHGGGFCVGSARGYRGFAARFGAVFGSRTVVPDYHLAPELPYPAGLYDIVAVWDDLTGRQGVDPSRIAVAGDSAGGGFVLSLALRLRQEGKPLPGALGFISAWVDMSPGGLAQLPPAPKDILTAEMLRRFTAAYVSGGADASDPLVSPLLGDLAGLPPMVVHTCADDILADQCHALVAKAETAGVTVEHEVLEDAWHDIHVSADILREPYASAPQRFAEALARAVG